jgi:uncharacterized membrane protein YfcA
MNTSWSGKSKYIDFDLVRAIVPLSLAGTIIGVLLNTVISDFPLLVSLSVVLCLIFVRTGFIAHEKFKARHTVVERGEIELAPHGSSSADENSLISSSNSGYIRGHNREHSWIHSKVAKNLVMTLLIPIVVICGVYSKSIESMGVKVILYIIPVTCCVAVAIWFDVGPENRNLSSRLVYALVGFIGGVCSGLFGIGGGLIFAPFLLHQGIEAAVAVAVSSTTVLYASASTAFQYIFLGRVAIVVGLVLSIASILGSVVAVLLVRSIAQRPKKQFILYIIVAAVVLVSAVLAIIETINSA